MQAVTNRRSRRAVETVMRQAGYMKDFDLTGAAFSRLTANLAAYGNDLTEKHREALMCILGRFTMLANGTKKGRYGYDLPCGGGKTQAIVAWAAELVHQDKPYSVGVCASKVEALCDLKRALIANGVPEDKIGLVHSYKFSPEKADAARHGSLEASGFASEPTTENNAERPILLVTHARVRGSKALSEQMSYKNRKRDLIVWDESLIVSDHKAIERRLIDKALGYLKPDIVSGRASEELVSTFRYLVKCQEALNAEMDFQEQAGRQPNVMRLPGAEPDEIDAMLFSLPKEEVLEPLRQLLSISQAPLRVIAESNGGYVRYEIAVPAELENVAVLDASWAIRDLERLDSSIQDDPSFRGDVTNYKDVEVNHLRTFSGRYSLTRDFGQRKEDRKVSQEIVSVIGTIPEDEGVIVFTFKPRFERLQRRKLDMAETLKQDLRSAGIDPETTLSNGKPRFIWLTWGMETSISAYSYASNVIFAGVLNRSDVDLAGAIVGQRDNLLADVKREDLRRVRTSECAYSIHQALSRGSCRINKRGYAQPMRAWLIYPSDDIKPLLARAMPGLVWKDWTGTVIEARTNKIEDAAAKVADYLWSLPVVTERVSVRVLKEAAGLKDLPMQTFVCARDKALSEVSGWTLVGRSLVRT